MHQYCGAAITSALAFAAPIGRPVRMGERCNGEWTDHGPKARRPRSPAVRQATTRSGQPTSGVPAWTHIGEFPDGSSQTAAWPLVEGRQISAAAAAAAACRVRARRARGAARGPPLCHFKSEPGSDPAADYHSPEAGQPVPAFAGAHLREISPSLLRSMVKVAPSVPSATTL